MHVVDDIHRLIIYTSDRLEHLEVVGPDFIEVQYITLELGDTLDHQRSTDLTATTIDS